MSSRLAAVVATLAFILPIASVAASQNPSDLPAGRYALDKKHASVTAKVMHLGVSLYTMRFDTIDGSFTYDPAHPEAAQVRANVDATFQLDVRRLPTVGNSPTSFSTRASFRS